MTSPETAVASGASGDSKAAEFISQPTFHRRLTLPATDSHVELVVTYAVSGNLDAARTVLFIGGMMGGRYIATIEDFVGQKYDCRVVVVDRPGIGGSTNVKITQRLAVWLETVPVLMRELAVEHVSILAHSCGVIYALNTVYAMPEILPPSHPALYLLTPWVHPQHSGVRLMSAASMLPSPLINCFDSVASFVGRTIVPTVGFSSSIMGSVASKFTPAAENNPRAGPNDAPRPKGEREDLCQEFMGISPEESEARLDEAMRRLWKEETQGLNSEALLSLRKSQAGSWGVCDDYELLHAKLEERMRQHFWRGDDAGRRPRFLIKVFWAEQDIMIGKGGEKYFDECFKDCAFESEGQCLYYDSEVVSESDHDSVCFPQYGALPSVLSDIRDRT